jgi:hypothetical protein
MCKFGRHPHVVVAERARLKKNGYHWGAYHGNIASYGKNPYRRCQAK